MEIDFVILEDHMHSMEIPLGFLEPNLLKNYDAIIEYDPVVFTAIQLPSEDKKTQLDFVTCNLHNIPDKPGALGRFLFEIVKRENIEILNVIVVENKQQTRMGMIALGYVNEKAKLDN